MAAPTGPAAAHRATGVRVALAAIVVAAVLIAPLVMSNYWIFIGTAVAIVSFPVTRTPAAPRWATVASRPSSPASRE